MSEVRPIMNLAETPTRTGGDGGKCVILEGAGTLRHDGQEHDITTASPSLWSNFLRSHS